MAVTRCICADQSFHRLRDIAQRDGLDLAALTRRTGAGGGCGLCVVYLRRMLATGDVRFELCGETSGKGVRTAGELSTCAQPERHGRG